jgi:hypothetical protein
MLWHLSENCVSWTIYVYTVYDNNILSPFGTNETFSVMFVKVEDAARKRTHRSY